MIASDDLNNSGVPNVIYQTIKALQNECSIDVVVFGDDLYYKEKLNQEGIIINTIRLYENKPKTKIGRFFWYYSTKHKKNYKSICKIISQNNYYAVHSFKEDESWPFLKAAKKYAIKKRIVYSNITLKKPSNLLEKIIWRRGRKLTNKLSTIRLGGSDPCCKSIYTRDYKVIHTSYNESKFNNSNEYIGDRSCLNLTHVANFCTNKNQIYTLSVFNEMLKENNNCKLRLIGKEIEDGYLQIIKQKVSALGIGDKVEIYESKNVNEELMQTTFLILPSFSEGAPITTMEAQACGIYCFVSNKVTREIDCGGCIFIDVNGSPSLASQKIIKLFKKTNNKRTEFDMSEFSFENFKKKMLSIYDK